MKKILIPLLLFAALSANAQTDTAEVQTDSVEIQIITLPDSTAIGAPDGKSVSKEIGPAGGKIVSDDGRVELIFPPAALTANKTISIQPITNVLPNGSGKAYRFEPSGIRFIKPVELIFHYAEEEEKTCPPLLMFIAIQSSNGKWEYMDYEDWDSTAMVLKGSLAHFSDMVNGKLAELYPREETLKVGKTFNLVLNIVQPPQQSSNQTGEDELAPLPTIAPLDELNAEWSVNGKEGGSVKYGKIQPLKNKSTAIYTAPGVLTPDPITVTLKTYIVIETEKITRSGKRKGKMITKIKKREYFAKFTTDVKLYDEYKISLIYKMKSPVLNDSASFIATVYPHKADITDILNYPPTAKVKDPYRCKAKVIIDESCVGVLNIEPNDIIKYTVSKENPPKIYFKLSEKKVLAYKLQYICEYVPPEPVTNIELISEPHEIKFIANGLEQNINYSGLLKIVVTPVR